MMIASNFDGENNKGVLGIAKYVISYLFRHQICVNVVSAYSLLIVDLSTRFDALSSLLRFDLFFELLQTVKTTVCYKLCFFFVLRIENGL